MSLKPPAFIEGAGVIVAPLNFKWSSDLGLKFYAARDQNPRLSNALSKSSYKARTATGIAATEWVLWRLHGHIDIADGLQRVEAAWATIVDAAYSKSLVFSLTDENEANVARSAFEISIAILGGLYHRYVTQSVYIEGPVVRQCTLARHVVPKKAGFDTWLSDALARAERTFPRDPNNRDEEKTFDASHEQPVPREFFNSGFAYSEQSARELLAEFLKGLDPSNNPYLCSAEQMKASGFKGTPYAI